MVAHSMDYPMDCTAYKNATKVTFEDSMFNAPANTDHVLTSLYGDYMTPPPVSEQKSHELYFGKVIYSCETDFKDVLEELKQQDN